MRSSLRILSPLLSSLLTFGVFPPPHPAGTWGCMAGPPKEQSSLTIPSILGESREPPHDPRLHRRGYRERRWVRIAYLFVSWNTLLRISPIAVSARSFGKQNSSSSFPAARDLIRNCTILHSTLKWKTSSPGMGREGREDRRSDSESPFRRNLFLGGLTDWLVPSPKDFFDHRPSLISGPKPILAEVNNCN